GIPDAVPQVRLVAAMAGDAHARRVGYARPAEVRDRRVAGVVEYVAVELPPTRHAGRGARALPLGLQAAETRRIRPMAPRVVPAPDRVEEVRAVRRPAGEGLGDDLQGPGREARGERNDMRLASVPAGFRLLAPPVEIERAAVLQDDVVRPQSPPLPLTDASRIGQLEDVAGVLRRELGVDGPEVGIRDVPPALGLGLARVGQRRDQAPLLFPERIG